MCFTAAAVLAAATPGCAPTLAPDITAEDPVVKIPAIVEADASGDDLRALVDALAHEDPAVRLFAIESLRRLTGEDLGYQPYGTEAQRARAVREWRRRIDHDPSLAGGGSP